MRNIAIVRTAIGVAIAMAALWSPAEAGDVKKLATTLRQLPANPNQSVFVRFGADKFELVRLDESAISKKEFEKERSAATSLPELEFEGTDVALVIPLSEEDAVLEYKSSGSDAAYKWTRRKPALVESYTKNEWHSFLKVAVAEGLFQYIDQTTKDGDSFIRLRFRRPSPNSVKSPGGVIALSDEFYDSMQLSPEYAAHEGTNGFVLLVHEPHSDFVGQKGMLRGLRALRSANAKREFEFLIEGSYVGDRTLGYNGLDATLDAAADKGSEKAARLVLALLSRHVINGPMAYRLLYGRVDAYAIDDLEALKKDVGGSKPIDATLEIKAVDRILTAIETASTEDPDHQRQTEALILSVHAYMTATIGEIGGQQLVGYYHDRATILDMLVEVAKTTPDLKKDVALLRSQAKAYRVEESAYKVALQRDQTMADQIRVHVSSKNRKISVGFIGSFHTQGVTSSLRAAGIGYVVVEPRISGFKSSVEEDAFDRMIHRRATSDVVRDALKRNSGPVAPSETEVGGPIRGFFKRDVELPRFTKPKPDWVVNRDRLSGAVGSNPSFGAAPIEFERDGAPPVPSAYKGAFAYLEMSSESRVPNFVVVDPRGPTWKKDAPYAFIENAVIVPSVQDDGIASHSRVTFFQDRTSKQVFATVHDPASGRFYLMGADDALGLLDQIGPPQPKNGKTVRAHLQMSDIDAPLIQEMACNG